MENKRIVTVLVPSYNEEKTLAKCIDKLVKIEDDKIQLEVLIIDDASKDHSLEIAHSLSRQYTSIRVLSHSKNKGKGAALNTGIKYATGEIIAIQDADLEYDPQDLRKLFVPIFEGYADVVYGSRYLSSGEHRVLYFWHSIGNAVLTFLSNMFTDLNLTDMETCYKVFRADILKQIEIKEARFGIEPEITAKIAQLRVRIYEMGIKYHGRTYEEGKKIGIKDGFRALYCIFHYNAPKAPLPIQFLIYLFIGGLSAVFNLQIFVLGQILGWPIRMTLISAYVFAALLNYFLCIQFLFRHKAKWNPQQETLIFSIVVVLVGCFDFYSTLAMIAAGISAVNAKIIATAMGLILNFVGRKYIVFFEKASGKWRPQEAL